MGSYILGGIAIVIGLIVFFSSVKIVPQAYVYVVERLGKYYKSCDAGLNIIVPFIDRVSSRVNLKEQVFDFPPQSVITKDNVAILIDSVVFMRVTDPELFTYGVQNPIQGIENLSATTLRSLIGAMEFDETLTSREHINARMLEVMDKATDAWGIKITRAEVKNIQPPADILEVMQKQMTAERDKRQAILDAEAYKQSSVTHAEGDKQAKILAAQAESEAAIALARGQAESIRIVYNAEAEGLRMLMDVGVSEPVLKLKAIQAMKDVANGNATKIFFPTDLTAVGTIGVSGEAFDGTGSAKASPVAPPPQGTYIAHPQPIGSSHITQSAANASHNMQVGINKDMMQRRPMPNDRA